MALIPIEGSDDDRLVTCDMCGKKLYRLSRTGWRPKALSTDPDRDGFVCLRPSTITVSLTTGDRRYVFCGKQCAGVLIQRLPDELLQSGYPIWFF